MRAEARRAIGIDFKDEDRVACGVVPGPGREPRLPQVVGAVVAVPCLVAVWLLGAGVWAFVVGGVTGGVGVLVVCWVGRAPLHVAELAGILRRR